jgi:hypothetical protein
VKRYFGAAFLFLVFLSYSHTESQTTIDLQHAKLARVVLAVGFLDLLLGGCSCKRCSCKRGDQ